MKSEIYALYKRPGKSLTEVRIPNELEWMQGAVEGYVEAVPLRPDLAMLVNEEGKLKGMTPNFRIDLGVYWDEIAGPVLFVGVDGEGFTDCPLNKVDLAGWLLDKQTEVL